MKKRFAQLVSCYLALSLALGGAVALSPFLHVWIEHGGEAGPHTHLTMPAEVAAVSYRQAVHHLHSDAPDTAHLLSHTLELSQPSAPDYVSTHAHVESLFVHSYEPFRPPSLSALWHSLHAAFHLLGGRVPAASGPASSGDTPDHQHHSLPQLLAGGAVEQHLDLPLLQPVPVSLTFRVLPAHPPLLDSDWDAQMASRGPPPKRS